MIVDVLFEPNAYILNALTNDDHLTISTRPKYVMCHCFYIILNLFFCIEGPSTTTESQKPKHDKFVKNLSIDQLLKN